MRERERERDYSQLCFDTAGSWASAWTVTGFCTTIRDKNPSLVVITGVKRLAVRNDIIMCVGRGHCGPKTMEAIAFLLTPEKYFSFDAGEVSR